MRQSSGWRRGAAAAFYSCQLWFAGECLCLVRTTLPPFPFGPRPSRFSLRAAQPRAPPRGPRTAPPPQRPHSLISPEAPGPGCSRLPGPLPFPGPPSQPPLEQPVRESSQWAPPSFGPPPVASWASPSGPFPEPLPSGPADPLPFPTAASALRPFWPLGSVPHV